MQGNQEKPDTGVSLSVRIEEFRREIQTLVIQGVEHPRFEFKRSCSIVRENLEDRLDFIKLVQGVANADVTGERCIVIGADPKEKKWFTVSNGVEFDGATVSSVIAKYLDPVPRFQVFNNLQTDDGQSFVLFVLDADQPRPIVVKTEGPIPKSDGKVGLQIGQIWIKKDTGLQLATRTDLDSMYRLRMEEEAEDRARKRFKHFSELSGTPHSIVTSASRVPVRNLLVAPTPDFRSFSEELIAANDYPRFRMLLELSREFLVDGWDTVNARGAPLPPEIDLYVKQVNDFFRDEYLPSLQSLVSLGLLIIKYDFQLDWLQAVVGVLLEAFQASRGLQRLKSGRVIQEEDSLPWWKPAFEIFVAVRCLAIYAVSRDRLRFLGSILPKMLTRIAVDDQPDLKTSMLLWPLPPSLFTSGELNDGRSDYYWKERISTAWGKYFGSYEKFTVASCQLEFLLEWNSYIGTNTFDDPKIKQWLAVNGHDKSFIYFPDLFNYRLNLTTPIAEKCYDMIAADKPFPSELAIEPTLFQLAFKDKNREQRLLIYGGFLYHLKVWQEQTMFQQFRRFPFMYTWEGRLLEIVEKFKKQLPPKT